MSDRITSRLSAPTSSRRGAGTRITAYTRVRAGSSTTAGWPADCAAARWRRFLSHVSPEAVLSAFVPTWHRVSTVKR